MSFSSIGRGAEDPSAIDSMQSGHGHHHAKDASLIVPAGTLPDVDFGAFAYHGAKTGHNKAGPLDIRGEVEDPRELLEARIAGATSVLEEAEELNQKSPTAQLENSLYEMRKALDAIETEMNDLENDDIELINDPEQDPDYSRLHSLHGKIQAKIKEFEKALPPPLPVGVGAKKFEEVVKRSAGDSFIAALTSFVKGVTDAFRLGMKEIARDFGIKSRVATTAVLTGGELSSGAKAVALVPHLPEGRAAVRGVANTYRSAQMELPLAGDAQPDHVPRYSPARGNVPPPPPRAIPAPAALPAAATPNSGIIGGNVALPQSRRVVPVAAPKVDEKALREELLPLLQNQLRVAKPQEFQAALASLQEKYGAKQQHIDMALAALCGKLCQSPQNMPLVFNWMRLQLPGDTNLLLQGAILTEIAAVRPQIPANMPPALVQAALRNPAFLTSEPGQRFTAFKAIEAEYDTAINEFFGKMQAKALVRDKDFPLLQALFQQAELIDQTKTYAIAPQTLGEAFTLFLVAPDGAMRRIEDIQQMASRITLTEYLATVTRLKNEYPAQKRAIEEFDLNIRFKVDPSHFQEGVQDIVIPANPQGVKLTQLLNLFDEINFTDPSAHNYQDPSSLASAEHAGTSNPVELRVKLQEFITRLEGNVMFMGFPENSETRKGLYKTIENALTNCIKKIRDVERSGPAAALKMKKKMMMQVLGAAPHCGPREISVAIGQFKEVVKGIAPSFKQSVAELLAEQRTTAFEAMVKPGRETAGDFQALMHDYGEAYGIPGAKQQKALGKPENTPVVMREEAQKRFGVRYTSSGIIANMTSEIRMKEEFRDGYRAYLRENMPDSFKKAEFHAIQNEVAAQRAQGKSYTEILSWLQAAPREIYVDMSAVPQKTDAQYAAAIQMAIQEERLGQYQTAMTLAADGTWDFKPEGIFAMLEKQQIIKPLQFQAARAIPPSPQRGQPLPVLPVAPRQATRPATLPAVPPRAAAAPAIAPLNVRAFPIATLEGMLRQPGLAAATKAEIQQTLFQKISAEGASARLTHLLRYEAIQEPWAAGFAAYARARIPQ